MTQKEPTATVVVLDTTENTTMRQLADGRQERFYTLMGQEYNINAILTNEHGREVRRHFANDCALAHYHEITLIEPQLVRSKHFKFCRGWPMVICPLCKLLKKKLGHTSQVATWLKIARLGD